MAQTLRSMIEDILAHCDDITIATIRPDGWPQATTVSYVSDGMKVYFGTGANSQKARNLAKCDKVSATVNRPYRDWDGISGLSLAGRARLITDQTEMAHAGALMLKKFPQIARYSGFDMGPLAMFCITPNVVSVLDYSKGFGHTDLLEVA
jgi:nitroimidazol reductase NimA-like FMN-containing flavoprotein (pyridoxamine 5'-phosphate oxidase superfamily)